jgi:hypothetical protein
VVIAGPFDTQFFILGTLHIAFRTIHHDAHALSQEAVGCALAPCAFFP